MAIAEKLQNIINEKTAQATMTNYGLTSANQITSSTKFIDYPKYIFNAFLEALRTPDTLFTNLPKKSGTGANITLNDTANAPMRITLGASELTQASTPTPSSPQDIHTISGSNKVVVSDGNGNSQEADIDLGKNLLNPVGNIATANGIKFINNFDGTFTANGTASANTTFSLTDLSLFPIKLKANEPYTQSLEILSGTFGGSIVPAFKNSGGTITYNYFTSNATYPTQTKTPTEDMIAHSYNLYIPSGTIITNCTFRVQLEKGSSATNYAEYREPIEYCKIGNYEDKFIRTSGKNKLDNSKIVKGRLDNGVIGYESNTTALTTDENTISFTTNNNYRGVVSDFIPVQESTYIYFTYDNLSNSSFTIQVASYDENKTFIQNMSFLTITNGFEITNNIVNAKYIRIWLCLNTLGTETITNPMVEFGAEPSTYEPYGSNEWYIKKNIGKVVLDGTENFVKTARTYNSFQKTNFIDNQGIQYWNKPEMQMCTHFVVGSAGYANANCFSIDGVGSLIIAYLDIDNAPDFNTWLGNNTPTIYYALPSPTYTKITGTLANQLENVYQKLLSYDGTTNISQINNDLAFQLGVQAIEKL